MALGLERALAEYLELKGFGGLYDEVDPADRVIFVQHRPPAPINDPAEPGAETTSDVVIAIFVSGGLALKKALAEEWDIIIECRHQTYETAMEKQMALHTLLHENGGQSNGANAQATGDFGTIKIAWIRAVTLPELVGRDGAEEGGRFVTQQAFRASTKPITLT